MTRQQAEASTAQTRQQAEAWLAVDPDPETQSELRALLAGDPVELARRFGRRLSFGTAGIRGPMGAGPTRMNRVLVRIVAGALAERLLQERTGDRHVVVGFDARHRSRDFAADTARVLAGRGIAVTLLSRPTPTPVLAFAVKHLAAAAGVMVTASHNPRPDNGYKVYWRGGAQLAAPTDSEIGGLIARSEPLAEPDLAPASDPLIASAGDDLVHAYIEAVTALLDSDGPRTTRIAYTPLHGVGADTFLLAATRAGFDRPAVVSDQAEPDPDFPTAPFPNPEEPGVLDRLLSLAARIDADVALAHDPDADRLAVAVPEGNRWRRLTGDETGCLLAEHLLARTGAESTPERNGARRRLVINTVVSSRLLHRIAAHHRSDSAETLTGFKWIMKALAERSATHDLVLAYEDALGYAVGSTVADKDGISAALVMAELVAVLQTQGRTVCDLLDDLNRRHGVHATAQRSVRFDSSEEALADMAETMRSFRSAPPDTLGGSAVTAVRDLAAGDEHLPPADVVILHVGPDRVIVRPSGTEPKMKVYAEVAAAPRGAGRAELRAAREDAGARLCNLLDDTATALGRMLPATRGGTPGERQP